MKKFLILLILPVLCSGCLTNLSIPVLKPAQINMPTNFEKLAVVNRSRAAKANMAGNIIEGILTGEGVQGDKEGGEHCLSGVKDALLKTPRYVVVEPNVDLRGTGTGAFPPPLNWAEVEKICKDNGADALIVLELFDSNSLITPTSYPVKVKNKEGVESTVTEYAVTMRITITSGWRIYDYGRKIIVDEFRGEDFLTFSAKGSSAPQALAALIVKREAVKKTGFHAGSQYGFRISPQWINVTREYYTKGSDNLKKAGRMARVNDWKGAAEIWNKLSASQDKKIAKRSTHNMAVASEVLGNLEAAKEWADKAYQQFGSKPSLRYSRVIQNRIRDEERLKEQMK